jgi:hypothetical protein
MFEFSEYLKIKKNLPKVLNWYVYFVGKISIIFPAILIESELQTHIKLWCPKKR